MRRALTALVSPALVFSIIAAPSAGFADAPEGRLASARSEKRSSDYASPERQEVALGHYAKARALLVEALAEFEQGRSVARPDVLIDPIEWRLMIVAKTEELNRLLDPQPRVTRSGARYKAHKSLLRTDRSAARASLGGPQDSNYAGEDQMSDELSLSKKSETNTKEPASGAITRTESTRTESTRVASTGSESTEAIDLPKAKPTEETASAKLLVSPREVAETEETLNEIKKLESTVNKVADDLADTQLDVKKSSNRLEEAALEAPPATASITPKKMDMTGESSEPELGADLTKSTAAAATARTTDSGKISEQENLEISKAIEDAIKARLKKVDSMDGKNTAAGAKTAAQPQ